MKGIGFTIKIVITIIIALVVMVSLIMLLLQNRMPVTYSSLEVGCLELLKDCAQAPSNINFDVGGKLYNLWSMCQELGIYDENKCREHCGCA